MLTPHCMTRRPGLFVVWEHVRTYVPISILIAAACLLPAPAEVAQLSALPARRKCPFLWPAGKTFIYHATW